MNSLYAVFVLLIFVQGCSCSQRSYESFPSEVVSTNSEDPPRFNFGSDESSYRGNPYGDGSGHDAGYRWAEDNEVDSCDGKSQSFIEGCEEYLEQRDQQQQVEEEDSE